MEQWAKNGQVEAAGGDVIVRLCNFDWQATLRCTNIKHDVVVAPMKRLGQCLGHRPCLSGQSTDKHFAQSRVRVERTEVADRTLVTLRLAGPNRRGERSPNAV